MNKTKWIVGGLVVALVAIIFLGTTNKTDAQEPEEQYVLVPVEVLKELILSAAESVSDAMFGATGTRFPNGISADSTSPSAGQVRGTTLTITSSATIGSTGTALTAMLSGTCNAYGPSAGLSASSTAVFMCDVTNVAASDKVFVSLPNRTNSNNGENELLIGADSSIMLTGAAFATTTGVIGFELGTLGPATTTFPQATTSIHYWVVR